MIVLVIISQLIYKDLNFISGSISKEDDEEINWHIIETIRKKFEYIINT